MSARGLVGSLPKGTHVAMLPAIACQDYLDELLRRNFNVFDMTPMPSSGTLPLRMWWQRFRKTF